MTKFKRIVSDMPANKNVSFVSGEMGLSYF